MKMFAIDFLSEIIGKENLGSCYPEQVQGK